ncbi:MAG: hypothetical protein R3F54_17635 [Alphaproteobacteria bacterium]
MIRHFSALGIAVTASLALTSFAWGDDRAPARTAWTKADPASGEAVRWVVEGCAAYPVTAEAEQEVTVAEETSARSEPDITAGAGLSIEAR